MNKDISTKEGLREVILNSGLLDSSSVDTLLNSAEKSTDVKSALKSNNDLALKIGLCGVPSFVLKDEIFFGQDRISFLMDAIVGDINVTLKSNL